LDEIADFGASERVGFGRGKMTMWPFRKKDKLPGIKQDKDGNLSAELTEEERRAIDDTLRQFEGQGIHRDHYDDIISGVTAFALANYATRQVILSENPIRKEDRLILLDKAIAAITKAYSFYELPIYIYDLAYLMEMAGKSDLAKNVYRLFLDKQAEYTPRQVDEAFIKERDINEAVKDAEAKAS
jgi:hypothetical protein